MDLTENELRVEDLLSRLTEACARSAIALNKYMSDHREELPSDYVIPQMSVELKVEISYTGGQIKGFFRKQTDETRASSMSSIKLDIVAVPRTEPAGGSPGADPG